MNLEKKYEQLRSSSIDGSCQMVRTVQKNVKMVNMFLDFVADFWILGLNIDALLLTVDFLVF